MNKKSIQKLSCILIAVCLLLAFTACNSSKGDNEQKKADSDILYNKGLELVGLLHEMVSSEEYITLFGIPTELYYEELTNGDYENCIAVYQVDISDTQLQSFMILSGIEPDNFSDDLISQITKKLYSSFIAQLVARQSGTEALAASSILISSSLFVYKELKEPTMYIYEYNDSYPVVVSFYPGDDGAVSAGANYFLIDELKAADEATFSDALSNQFALLGLSCDISKIK